LLVELRFVDYTHFIFNVFLPYFNFNVVLISKNLFKELLVKLIKKEKEKGIIGQTFSKGNILVNNKTIFVLLILKSKLLLQETDSIQFTFSHFFFPSNLTKKRMNSSSNPTPSSPPESTADDTEPFLRPRRSLHRTPTTPPLRTASRFIRRASSQHMMLNEPSVRVRERAAVEVEERQREWAYSKPVVALDIAWNLSFLVVSVVVLGLSNKEEPCVPLRVWILGYLLQGLVHSLCVFSEFRRRRRDSVLEDSSHDLESGPRWSLSSETDSDVDVDSQHFLENQENRYYKQFFQFQSSCPFFSVYMYLFS
jgi:hypothetical protein